MFEYLRQHNAVHAGVGIGQNASPHQAGLHPIRRQSLLAKPLEDETQIVLGQLRQVQFDLPVQPPAQCHAVGSAPGHDLEQTRPRRQVRQQVQFHLGGGALPARDIDPRQGRLGPDRIAAKITYLIPAPVRRVPLGERVVVVADAIKRVGLGRLDRISADRGPLEALPGMDLGEGAARGFHIRRRRFCPADRQGGLNLEDRRQAEQVAQLPVVADAGVPDALEAAQVGAQDHVVGGARNGLGNREIPMGPALLETEENQRRAVGEVQISAGYVARAQLALLVGDDDEVPVLQVARRGRLGAVAHDLGQDFAIDLRAVEIAAGMTLGQPVEDGAPIRRPGGGIGRRGRAGGFHLPLALAAVAARAIAPALR